MVLTKVLFTVFTFSELCIVQYICEDDKQGAQFISLIGTNLWWSTGERAGLWYQSSWVQTRLKPSDFSGEKSSVRLPSEGK